MNAITVGCGNVYVTGRSEGEYATIKYYPTGDTAWIRRYNGQGLLDDRANAIAVDGWGNVYVTGAITDSEGYQDYATAKYYPDGDTAWVRKYSKPEESNDRAFDIAVDSAGNIYVTGTSEGDYATIKYYPNGDTAWVRIYDGPSNGWDEAYNLAVDGFGNVYVTGESWGGGTAEDYATIKYYSNGDTAWVRRYDGGVNGPDWARAMTLDASGNVYVTGGSYGIGTDFDYVTIEYDSNGNEGWIRRYNGPVNGYDWAYDLVVDDSGNVYVTGESEGIGTSADYATIKYVKVPFLRGDANGDRVIDIGDVVYLINYLYKNGPSPHPLVSGDANNDGIVDVGDVVYLINYLFKFGPLPSC